MNFQVHKVILELGQKKRQGNFYLKFLKSYNLKKTIGQAQESVCSICITVYTKRFRFAKSIELFQNE